jgi:hypothetical protein
VLKTLKFGELTPDLASTSDHLTVAKNCRAVANGYGPMPAFSGVTTALGAAFVGGGSFIASDASSTMLGATAAKLRKFSGSWSDVISVVTTSRWYFAQFGDNIIYANGAQLGKYILTAGTAAVIATSPTNAIDVATVKDFVMCLTADSQAVWSAFNDSTGWTSGTDQSDYQPLLDGGTGVRIVGGEYGIILQKSAIRRATYTGQAGTIFQFDVISPEIGCMAAGSVSNVGRLIFFLSERGFELCDGQDVVPISDNKLNAWFFETYSRQDIANIWSAIDPRRNEVWWVMPGTPGTALIYNWVLKRWTTAEADMAAVISGRTSNTSLDALDAIYGDLDSITVSLDDPILAGGNPLLLLANSSNVLGAMSGANLAATFQVKNIELAPGKRSRLRGIRPVTDATTATAIVDARMRAGDSEDLNTAATMRTNGKMPIRANGRYHGLTLTIPASAAWTYVQGCEFEFEAGDGR